MSDKKPEPTMAPHELEMFEQAFRPNHSGCRGTCVCGREFYNSDGGWDWEDGELEALAKAGASDLSHSVGYVEFEGREFVDACDCWHVRAARIVRFVLGHDDAIAKFLTLERKRLWEEAQRAPEVLEPDWLPMHSAPKDCTVVSVRMEDGTEHAAAHWACDLSGEEQPPFKGWFIPATGGKGYNGIAEPAMWKPTPGHKAGVLALLELLQAAPPSMLLESVRALPGHKTGHLRAALEGKA